MARNQFIDPAGVRATYDWAVNHSEEEEFGKERNIENGANTANTGLIKQQSDDSPLVMALSGTILHKAQLTEMLVWYEMCEEQTIHFKDFAGDRFEVIITAFKPTRHRTVRNPRDYDNAPLWYWKYELRMEVIRVVSGTWVGVSP